MGSGSRLADPSPIPGPGPHYASRLTRPTAFIAWDLGRPAILMKKRDHDKDFCANGTGEGSIAFFPILIQAY